MARKPKQPKAKRGAAVDPNNWWGQTVEAPRSDLPDPDRQAKRAKRYRRWVVASVIIAPISMFANFAQFATADTGQTSSVDVKDAFSETRPVALVAVRQWLAGTPSPLPNGTLIGWDKATSVSYTPPKNSDDLPYDVETHYLTVAAANGATFTTTVQVADDPVHGPVVLGSPSLVPVPPSDTSWEANPYPGSQTAILSETAENAAIAWANAYGSNDPTVLASLIQDPTEGHSYVPLSGARLLNPEVSSAWVSPKATTKPDEDPDYVFAEVTAGVDWAYAPVDENNGESPATLTFTVLIKDANTGAAHVVAWGGPGTGTDLTPYMNAVAGRDFSSSDNGSLSGSDSENPIGDPSPSATSGPNQSPGHNGQSGGSGAGSGGDKSGKGGGKS